MGLGRPALATEVSRHRLHCRSKRLSVRVEYFDVLVCSHVCRPERMASAGRCDRRTVAYVGVMGQQRATSKEQRAESREQRAKRNEGREQRATSREQRAKRNEQRAQSKEQRAKSKEHRAKSREKRGQADIARRTEGADSRVEMGAGGRQ